MALLPREGEEVSPRSARARILKWLVAGASAVAAGSVLSGCAGTTGGFTKVTFIPVDQSGPQVEIAASGGAIPEYRIPGGRDGRLLLEFAGPYGDGTGLGDTCTITWDKVGTKTLAPVDNGSSYSVAYDLPGGVSAGSSSASLTCKIATGGKGGGSFEMQFVIIAVYDYVYWGHTDGIGRVRTDGTDIKPKFITGVKEVRAIAVHADKIYFSHSKGIGRADLDGDNVEADFIPTNEVADAIVVYSHGAGDLIEWSQKGRIGSKFLPDGRIDGSSAPDITAMAASHGQWYFAVTHSGGASLSSPAYPPGEPPRLTGTRVPGLTIVGRTPYWTSDNKVNTLDADNRPSTVYQARPWVNLKGLAYSGKELFFLGELDRAQAQSLFATRTDGSGERTVLDDFSDATGAVAAGPGRDPAPRVSVEDSDGKKIQELVGPTFTSPTAPVESVAFYLRNSGNADLKSTFVTVISGDRNSFTESPGTGSCGFATVGPGQRCFVRIDYDPATPGKHRAVVRVSGNMNPTGYVDVPVSAEWIQTAPEVSVSPASVDFGPHAPGYPSEYTTVTVTNTGSAGLTVPAGGVTLAGTNRDDFDFTGTCDDVTVQPAQTCSIEVLFNPTANGSRSGSLQIASNAPGSPTVVPLTGTGVPPALSFAPDPVPSVTTAVGTDTSFDPITVTNTSGASVTIPADGVQITGGDADKFGIVSQTCAGQTLAASATCSIHAEFVPGLGTMPGDYSADLELTHGGAGNPLMASLSGTATAPPS